MARLEAGLIQRARLLNALLADLYGPQRAPDEGLAAARAGLRQPQFLRPCHGVAVRDDLICTSSRSISAARRTATGGCSSDRTQAPSGAGYALENRVVISQLPAGAVPRAQRAAARELLPRVQRRASCACRRREQPHAVLLSPGPTQQNYFEHAYLARYLGYSWSRAPT